MSLIRTCPVCGGSLNKVERCERCVDNLPLARLVQRHPLQAERLLALLPLIEEGRKTEAIRRLRELLPMGLKEAKDVVDGVDRAPD